MSKSPYLNPDGTFKGGWDGCIAHMTQIEGHSAESAAKICGYIKQHKMGNDAPILSPIVANRAADGQFALPSDGWYQLAPKGEYHHPESGLTQVLDDEAMRSIVNRFQAEAAEPHFAGLRVDYEHFSYDPGKSSTAAGWITGLQNRGDGLWAQIKWSAQGEQDVKGGNYRFISPCWLADDVQTLGNQRIRPLRLDTAGLTNNPNLRGMVPLSNRSASQGAADTTTTPPQPKRMKSLCTALGLSADASEEAALAELHKLKNRATAAEAALEPGKGRIKELEIEITQLKNRNTELLASVVEQDLAKYANRFAPEAKEKWKAQLLANRAATLELLESLPEPKTDAGNAGKSDGKPMHNRAMTKTPEAGPAGGQDKDAKRAKAISNRAQRIMREDGKTAAEAWRQAESELGVE